MWFIQLFAALTGLFLFFWGFVFLALLFGVATENWPLVLVWIAVWLYIRPERSTA